MSTCAECKYFDPAYEIPTPYGECRINPPGSAHWVKWPQVTTSDWCGQFAAKQSDAEERLAAMDRHELTKARAMSFGLVRRCVDCNLPIGKLTTCPVCLTPQVHA